MAVAFDYGLIVYLMDRPYARFQLELFKDCLGVLMGKPSEEFDFGEEIVSRHMRWKAEKTFLGESLMEPLNES